MSIQRTDAEKLSRLLGQPGLLGQLAVMNGFMGEDDLARCLEEQKSSPNPSPLGEILVSRNLITSEQLKTLLDQQKRYEEHDRSGNPPLQAGETDRSIGHYTLKSKLGEGGGGTVWKAWDDKLCRWVALKESRAQRPAARERFNREARTAAQLKHPNLVQVHEVTSQAGQDFIVMEYIDGRPLDGLKLSASDAAALVADIADAVEYMHAAGIIHRDLKPQNILVDQKGIGHLGDFGIAKVLDHAPVTLEGALIGTPQYMAPEQVDGKSEAIGPRTDVYGLGATLHFCLVGKSPYPDQVSLEGTLSAIRFQDPSPPRALNLEVPPELDVIVRRAMARVPQERYPSAGALRDDLRRFLRGESILARPDSLVRKALRWSRRNGRRVGAVVLAALASATAVGLYTFRRHADLGRQQEAYEAALENADRLWQKATGLIRAGRPAPEAFQGTLEQAIGLYQTAAASNPAKPYPQLMLGRCFMLVGRRIPAEAAWTQALRIKSSYGPALFERGKSALGTYVRLELMRGSPKAGAHPNLDPRDPGSAEVQSWRKKGEEDLASARGASDLEKPSVSYLEGMLELGHGRYPEAVRALGVYVAEAPWDADALTYLGAAFYRMENFEGAKASWSRALELQPSAVRHKLLGDVAFCQRQFSEAVDHYSRALALDPGNSAAQCNRGLAHQALGNVSAALEDFTGALAQSPKFARAYNSRGTAWLERGDLDRALEDFERAAESNEFYAEAHNNLGTTHVRRHEIEQGINEYGIALEIHPRYPEAHFNRGIAHLLKGDLELAIRDFENASVLDPKDPESLYQLALAERSKGDDAKSVSDLSRAIELGQTGWARRSQAQETLRVWKGR